MVDLCLFVVVLYFSLAICAPLWLFCDLGCHFTSLCVFFIILRLCLIDFAKRNFTSHHAEAQAPSVVSLSSCFASPCSHFMCLYGHFVVISLFFMVMLCLLVVISCVLWSFCILLRMFCDLCSHFVPLYGQSVSLCVFCHHFASLNGCFASLWGHLIDFSKRNIYLSLHTEAVVQGPKLCFWKVSQTTVSPFS